MERGWKLPLLLIGVLALGAIAALMFFYDPDEAEAPLAEPFDPTGRTRPSWAVNEDPREDARSLHIVRYIYSASSGRPPATSVTEAWVEFDEDGRPLRATGINHSTPTLDWYADRSAAWRVGCSELPAKQMLHGALPGMAEVDGMLASGYCEVPLAPLALPENADPPVEGDMPPAARRLEATFGLSVGTWKQRAYLLDEAGRVIAFRGVTVVNGRMVNERFTFVTSLEFDVEVEERLDAAQARFAFCRT